MKFIAAVPIRFRRLVSTAIVLILSLLLRGSRPFASAQTDEFRAAFRTEVRIGVFGLFHTVEFTVTAPIGQALVLQSGEERMVLEKSSGVESAEIQLSGKEMVLAVGPRIIRSSGISIHGRANEPVDFILAIPGKITRRYHGVLEIQPSVSTLVAIVTLELEAAVASVVSSESSAETPLEALKAQAVAARSYFIAGGGRHRHFDFCDTTHCQFLREPPAAGSDVANAVADTRGLVLSYHLQPIAAMYTRSCSGRTRTPAEVRLSSVAYPYYSVDCKYCRSHPLRWRTRMSLQDAAFLRCFDESARLDIGRRLGWSAVPSNDFVVVRDGNQMLVKGIGQGHGIGLCQSGAKAMAEKGANFREILSHYYPNATVIGWAGRPHPVSATR